VPRTDLEIKEAAIDLFVFEDDYEFDLSCKKPFLNPLLAIYKSDG
jgi:hypothetical protein